MNKLTTRLLEEDDSRVIANAFKDQGWNKPESQYIEYYKQQQAGERRVIVAEYDGQFAGYLTIVYEPKDDYFRERGIPEIVDFNVLIKFQRQGVGSYLMDIAEKYCFEEYKVIGLSVGLLSDYGSAQRLYVKRGYLPTGTGIKYGNKTLEYFDNVQVDDDLVLSFTKRRDPVS